MTKEHKVFKKDTVVFLNLPNDCIYEISNFFLTPSEVHSIILTSKQLYELFTSPKFFGCENVMFNIKGDFSSKRSIKNYPKSSAPFVKKLNTFFEEDEEGYEFNDYFVDSQLYPYKCNVIKKFLQHFPRLKFLQLETKDKLTKEFIEVLIQIPLKEFHWRFGEYMKFKKGLYVPLSHMLELEVFSLSFCEISLFNVSIDYPPNLKELTLRNVHNLFFLSDQRFYSLRKLCIYDVVDVQLDFESPIIAPNLKSLLINYECSDRSFSIKPSFFAGMENLEELIVIPTSSFYMDENNTGLPAFNYITKLPSLKKFKVIFGSSFCSNDLSDEVMKKIRKIQHVDMCNCEVNESEKLGGDITYSKETITLQKRIMFYCKHCRKCRCCQLKFNSTNIKRLVCSECKGFCCIFCSQRCNICSPYVKSGSVICAKCCPQSENKCSGCEKNTFKECFEECFKCKKSFCFHVNGGNEKGCIEVCSSCGISRCKKCLEDDKFIKCLGCGDEFGNGLFCEDCAKEDNYKETDPDEYCEHRFN